MSHVHALELQLEELRTKYNTLRRCYGQIKLVICEIEKKGWEGEATFEVYDQSS